MNCPCCGNEMKVGFLGSGQPIVWTPNKEKWILLPAEDRFPVAKVSLRHMAYAESYFCAKCDIIITPVSKRSKKVEDHLL